MLAGHASCQLQVRKIHTCHEEDAPDRSQQQPQRLTDVSTNLLGKWQDHDSQVDGEMIGGSGGLLDSIQFALGLLH